MSHDDHYEATRDFPAPWLPAPNLLLSSRFTLLHQLHCGAETELWTASDSAAPHGPRPPRSSSAACRPLSGSTPTAVQSFTTKLCCCND